MKKIAILSDIHNNLFTLNLFKRAASLEQFDNYFFCGDYITDGFEPNEIIEYIRSTSDYVIAGNRECSISEIKEYSSAIRWAPTMSTYRLISQENLNYVKELAISKTFDLESFKICISHGSPYNVREKVNFNNEEKLNQLIQDFNADIYVFGHTHCIDYRVYNQRTFINSGSLHALNDHKSSISYGILTLDQGKITYEQKIMQFDVDDYIEHIINSSYYRAFPIWSILNAYDTIDGVDYVNEFIHYVLKITSSDEEINQRWSELYHQFIQLKNPHTRYFEYK